MELQGNPSNQNVLEKEKLAQWLIQKLATKLQKSKQYGTVAKDRHRDQWDRTDSSDVNPYICYQFILNKKSIYCARSQNL